MDVKRILESIEQCTFKCDKCEFSETECHVDYDRVHVVLAIRDHVRAEVIAQVKEWVENEENIYGDAMGNPVLCKYETLAKLDELSKEETDNARKTVEGACCD